MKFVIINQGKMCTKSECSVSYARGSGNIEDGIETKTRRVPSFDRTVNVNVNTTF